MKDLVLDPGECMYSHPPDSSEKLLNLERAVLKDSWDNIPPVYVVQAEEFPGKYLIYNGNHRLHIADTFGKRLRAVLIESDKDLYEVPDLEYAHWRYAYYGPRSGAPMPEGTDYEIVVQNLCSWTRHTDQFLREGHREIDWETFNKSRLETLLDREDPGV